MRSRRVGDPAESTDTFHVQRLASRVRSLGAQLCEHRFRVADRKLIALAA